MEVKGIAENGFRCKYECVMLTKGKNSQKNEYGEVVETIQKISLDGDLQKTFDFIVRHFNLREDDTEIKSVDGITSFVNLQFKVISYGKHLKYDVVLRSGWDVRKRITINSTPAAYNVLARAFRETLGITVWQDKSQR